MGKQIDYYVGPRSGCLVGFATDNPIIVNTFRLEIELLKGDVSLPYLDRDQLVAYMEELAGGPY
jgi:hypothetical protein